METERLVVIPYLAEEAQGRELEFAVEGWRRFFLDDMHIVVVGDYHPIVDTGDDITFINCPRIDFEIGDNYRPHIDFVHKFKAVRQQFPESVGFIFACDDCYAVNYFDLTNILYLKQKADDICYDADSPNPWRRDKMKTRNALIQIGYPTRDFTAHLPVWFEWDKLETIWELLDMEHNSYVIEDLYFNIFYSCRIPFQLNQANDTLLFFANKTRPKEEDLVDALHRKLWISNSPDGYTPLLVETLSNYYQI